MFKQIVFPIVCLCLIGSASALRAADGTWTTDGDGNWSDIANWNFGSGPIADGASATANFTNTITAGRTVTSDTARTIGNLMFTGSGALNWTLTNSAALTLATGSGTSTITVTSNTATINASGAGLAGAQTVLKNGPGILSLAWNNTYSGGTVIGQGRVNIATVNSGQLGTGSVTITNNAILMLIRGDTTDQATTTGGFTNQVIIPAGYTGTIWNQPRGSISGTLTGAGTLNLQVNATRGDMSGNWSAFAGQINVTSRTGTSDFRHQNANGYTSGKVNLANGVNMYYVPNPPANTVGINFPIGELSGASGSTIQCGTALGRYVNYQVGGLNTSSTFAGQFFNTGANGYSRLIKVGTGSLTLTNNQPFYSPLAAAVAVTAGKLVLTTGGSISNSAVTVSPSATNGIQILSTGGQAVETNVVLSAGSALEFNYGTITPSASVAPLLALGTLSMTNTVVLNVLGGVWVPGTYPLIKYTGPLGGNGFSALSLGTLPLRVTATLNNNVGNSSIDLVVSAVTEPLKWSVGNASWDIGISSNWKDAASTITTYQEQLGVGDQVIFDDTASGSSPVTVTLNTNVSPASVTFSNVTKNYVLAGTSNILGGTTLTKAGVGTLTIQNTNSFTGAVNINGGTLNFKSLSNNLGAGSAINFGGGTLQFAAGNTDDISVRTVTINSGGATIDVGANNVSFSKRVGNGGTGGLTKTGSGILTLNTNSTFSGNTLVNQGTLALGANASLSNSAAVILNSGTTLDASATGFGFNLNGTAGQILAGTGTNAGSVTSAAGAIISPATNGVVGTLSFANDLNLNGGSYIFDVGNSSRDLMLVNGQLNIGGGTVVISPFNILTNGTYKLIQYASYGGGVNTLTLTGGQANKTFTLSDAISGEIDLVVVGSATNSLTWVGDGAGNSWDIDVTQDWLDNFTLTSAFFDNGDTVTFNDTGSQSPPVNIASAVSPSKIVVANTNTYTFYGAKISGGSTTLFKTGSGTLVLANVANDYGGATVVSNGVLQIGDGATAGTSIGSGVVTNNGSLVFNQPDNSSVASGISGTGSLTQMGANPTATVMLLGNNTYSGSTTVDTGVLQIGNGGSGGTLSPAAVTLANGGTLDLNHSGTYSLANGISGNGTLKLDGAATITLGGANSYLNNTYINNGVVKLSAANVIPSGGSTTGWLILDGGASAAGALDLNGFNQTVNALSGLGGTVQGRIYNNGSSQNTFTIGTIATTTYAGLIMNNTNGGSGSIALSVIGDGSLSTSLTLSGANTYTGPVLIDGAKLILGGSIGTIGQQAIGTGLVTLTNGGTLQMNGYGSATQSGNFINSILVPAGTTGSLFTVGRGVYNGSITVHGTLNLTTSYVRSQPDGNWSASDGQINLLAGTAGGDLYYNNPANVSYGTAAVDVGPGVRIYNAGNTGTGGQTYTMGELTGSGTITDCSQAGPASRVTTYIVGGRNSNATFSGTIANLARSTGITKVGAGSWTLNGTDTYSGPTTVNGGALIVGPSSFMTASTLITIAGGALLDVTSYAGLTLSANQTLAGEGIITGAVTAVTGDIISPGVGTAAGTLSFSNSLTETGDFVTNNFNLSNDPTGVSRTNSRVIVLGDLNLTGTNIVVINPLNTILGAGTYTLFKYGGTLMTNGVASVGGTLPNNLVAGGAFAGNSDVTLTFSNAPGAVVMIVTPNGQNLSWQGGITGTVTNNWDLNISSNWLNGVVVTNFLTYDNVTFDDSSTNLNVVLAGALAPGAIIVNSTNAYTFSGGGRITGGTGVAKLGTNVLTISNTGGNDYTGIVTIKAGVLKAGAATALGATNGATIVTNTGALDVGGFNLGAEPVTVSGSGSGNGAIINSGAAQLNALQFVTLSGDTTFGGTNRWDIRTNAIGAYLQGNGYNLTKVSTNDIYLVNVGNAGLGSISIQQGRLGVQDNTLLGTAGTLSLAAGSGLDFFNNGVTNSKPVTLTNATVSSSSGTNNYGGTINLNGTGTFTATTPLILNGALGGSGALVKNGASVLTLATANNYSGVTTISNGVLALIGTASFASSAAIEIGSGATLDVTAHTGGSITLASGQTLRGNGTVNGSVSAPAASTVSPGISGIGTLTITNTITLGGNTLMEINHDVVPTRDQIVATNIGFGGTLTVVNTGSALTLGDFFKLFTGANSGSFATIVLPALDPGLAWTNTLALNGTISVIASSSVNPNPTNITSVVNGNNLELSWPADHLGWRLQAQTNTIATGLYTNWVDVAGTGADNHYTNAINPAKGAVFYRLVYP